MRAAVPKALAGLERNIGEPRRLVGFSADPHSPYALPSARFIRLMIRASRVQRHPRTPPLEIRRLAAICPPWPTRDGGGARGTLLAVYGGQAEPQPRSRTWSFADASRFLLRCVASPVGSRVDCNWRLMRHHTRTTAMVGTERPRRPGAGSSPHGRYAAAWPHGSGRSILGAPLKKQRQRGDGTIEDCKERRC